MGWPWFGPHATDPSLPAHGFARTVPWKVIGTQAMTDGSARIDFRLIKSDATRALWPHSSQLDCHVTVGAALEIELATRNTDRIAVTIGAALHAYFEVGDIRQVTIRGLEGCLYLDKMDGGKRKQQTGPVTTGDEHNGCIDVHLAPGGFHGRRASNFCHRIGRYPDPIGS